MRWCLLAVCVSIGVSNVNSGCIDVPHAHGFEEGTKDLKDVEWIGKDLKYKLDHGIDKELLEKKGHFGEGFDKAHHLTGEKADIAVKKLHSMLGEDFKMEDLSEQDFKALASFLEHLSAESQGELFAKKEVSEKDSFIKSDDHSLKDEDAVKKVSLFDSAAEDVSSYLAESVLQMSRNQDASKYHHGSDEMLHKKLEEMKDLRSEEADSHYAMSDEEKAYFKEVPGSEKGLLHHEKGEKSLEEEALMKFMKLISDAVQHEEGSALLKEIIEHPDDESMEEVFKELTKKLYSEKGIGKEDHELKVVGHELHLKEGAHGLDKDLVYDEILKKEDGKIYDEEKMYGMKKSVDFDEHGKVAHGIKADEAAKSVSVRSAEAKKSKEGGKEIHDILKEEKYFISGGTTAYEIARDQAHVDAKVPPTIDEANKPFDTRKKILSEEEAKKMYHDEEHLFDESALKKDKGVHETKYAYGEETRKSMLDHGIGEEISGEKKYIDGGLKGKEIYGVAEDHLFKTEETHLMKGHHGKDDAIAVEKPHHGPLDLKKKFAMLLKRMLRMKKCYLVSMPPSELLGIIDCISRSKNPLLCEKFAMCEKKMPLQVILAQEKCQKEMIRGEVKRCSAFEPLYPSREIPLKIFKCIVKNTHELTPEEKKQMIDFEECARQVKVESCGRVPWG